MLIRDAECCSMREVQKYKLLIVCSFCFLYGVDAAQAFSKVWSCNAVLSLKMKDLKESEKNFHAYVEDKAQSLKAALRTSHPQRVAPVDALVAIRRAFSSEELTPSSHFKYPHSLTEFTWESQKQNMEELQAFFHGRRDFGDLRPSDFEVVIRIPEAPLHPVFFENLVKQVFELNTERLEYSLKAFEVYKETRKKDKNYYPVKLNEVAREMAIEYVEVKQRMPILSAMALQLFRLSRSEASGSIADLESVTNADFEIFLVRDSSYRVLLHAYLKLREALNQFTQDSDIQRQIIELQR